MNLPEEHKNDIIQALKGGNAILFTGAGFSCGAKNIIDNKLPLASNLADFMNQILKSFGKTGFKEDSLDLKTVSEEFFDLFKDSTNTIELFFKNHLKVNTCPDYYKNIKNVNWKNIYTTNYDDLLEFVLNKIVDGNKKYSISIPKSENAIIPKEKNKNLIYLNGNLEINPIKKNDTVLTDILCSKTDFIINDKNEFLWNFFIYDFIYNPIIIIGSQFEEKIFNEIITKLKVKTNINLSGRPKSFLIDVAEIDGNKKEKLRKLNIIPIKAKTEEFLNWLGEQFDSKTISDDIETKTASKKPKVQDFYTIMDENYWQKLKDKKEKDDLLNFYTRINSSPALLPYVIAYDFYVKESYELYSKIINNQEYLFDLDNKLDKLKDDNNSFLLKIDALGGTGKSTFLMHLAKKHSKDFRVIFFNDFNKIEDFDYASYKDEKKNLFIIDNYGKETENIIQFTQNANLEYHDKGYLLIIADRPLYNLDLVNYFQDTIECTLKNSQDFYKKVFSFICRELGLVNSLEEEFIAHNKLTTAERIIELLIKTNSKTINPYFKFDWNDWEVICDNNKLNVLKDLYAIVASFNYIDVTPPISYSLKLLDAKISDINFIRLISNIDDSPIKIVNNNCLELRNPLLSKYFILQNDGDLNLLRTSIQSLFNNFLNPTENEIYLLRNLHRNEKLLKINSLKRLLPSTDKVVEIFNSFIENNPSYRDNAKNRMELAIIYLNDKNNNKAINYLKEIIDLNESDIHARTKLADIYLREDKIQEAEHLINQLKKIDIDNPFLVKLRIELINKTKNNDEYDSLVNEISENKEENKVHLIRLYRNLTKHFSDKREKNLVKKYCNALLELNDKDYKTLNILAKIYKEEEDLEKSKELLLKSIELAPDNPHNYNELGQVYIKFYYKNNDSKYLDLAKNTFVEGINKTKDNIPLRTEYARYLIKFEFANSISKNEAEKILLDNIEIDNQHIYSYTELGIFYQKQNDFNKSEQILEQGLNTIKHADGKISLLPLLVVLGNTKYSLEYYTDAIENYKKSLKIKNKNLASYIGLCKSYLQLNNDVDYNNCLTSIINLVTPEELKIEEINLLFDFANWLNDNNKNDDGIKLIVLIRDNYKIDDIKLKHIQANILFNKIENGNIDENNRIKLYKKISELCRIILNKENNHPHSLSLLAKLNLHFIKNNFEVNGFDRFDILKTSLRTIFSNDSHNQFGVVLIFEYLILIKRYRLAIRFLKEYYHNHENQYYKNSIEKVEKLLESNGNLNNVIELNRIGFKNNSLIRSGLYFYNISETSITSEGKFRYEENNNEKIFFAICLNENNQLIEASLIEPYFESLYKNDNELLFILDLN